MAVSFIARKLVVPCIAFLALTAGVSVSFAASPAELFRLGVQAHDRRDLEKAAAYYEQALNLQSDFFEAAYNLGLAYADLSRYGDALRALEAARRLRPNESRVFGALASVKVRLKDYRGAEKDAKELLNREPSSQTARFVLAEVALEGGRFQEADEHLARIIAAEPQNTDALYMRAIVLLRQGHVDQGMVYLDQVLQVDPQDDRARRLRLSIQRAREEQASRASDTAEAAGFPGLLRWIVWSDKVLVLALILVVLVGTPLSFVQVRVAGRVRRAFDRTASERVLKAAYGFVLGFAVLLFYGSIPILVVNVLYGGWWLLYQIVSAGARVPVKLVFVIIAGAIGAAYIMVRSLFFRAPRGGFGTARTATEEPELYAVLREIAAKVGTKPVNAVYMSPTSSIGVHEEGGPFRALLGRARRVLTLGVPCFSVLTVQELKAILAHEYGHYSNRDTAVGAVMYRVTRSMGTMIRGMNEQGTVTFFNPAFWFLSVFHRVFLMISQGLSRSQELFADRVAAALYGPKSFASGLEKVAVEGSLFDSVAESWVAEQLKESRQFKNIFEAYFQRRLELERDAVEQHRQAILNRQPGRYDSHPPVPVRAAAVAGIPDPGEEDQRPAEVLLSDFASLQEQLTTFLTEYVFALSRWSTASGAETA